MFRHAIIAAAILLAACSTQPDSANNATVHDVAARLPLIVETAQGKRRFDVEVARTVAEQQRGLMFRKSVEAAGGMLFPMDPPRIASFWMKDTLVPLDIIFVRLDGTIAFIGADAVPYSREPVSAGIPVAAVLELRGGRARELGIREGDMVQWGQCAAPEEKVASDLDFCPRKPR